MLTKLLRYALTRSFKGFEFRDGAEAPDLQALELPGLYVHIPFCRSLCSFCPYCKELYHSQRAERYLECLLQEIRLAGAGLTEKKKASSLYFGGGTPALMVEAMPPILAELRAVFDITGGIGAELHPTDITRDTLQRLKVAGVTMVSLGIQTFDRGCLEKLGRPWEPFADKVRLVHDHGFSVIDVDLIFALPGQTADALAEDVRTAFASGATQVSTYPFIDFSFATNQYRPQGGKAKLRMLDALMAAAEEQGFERTSVWTLARPGSEKYSSVTRDPFIGFGLSAASLTKDQFRINTFSLEGYCARLENGFLPTALTLDFTERQRAAYHLFWSAYGLTIDPEQFQAVMGRPLKELYGRELALAEGFGILEKKDFWHLTDRGARLYHSVEQAYTGAYIDRMWDTLRRTPFPKTLLLK